MAAAAAGEHGSDVEGPEPGRGLAGVEDAAGGAGDGVHVGPGRAWRCPLARCSRLSMGRSARRIRASGPPDHPDHRARAGRVCPSAARHSMRQSHGRGHGVGVGRAGQHPAAPELETPSAWSPGGTVTAVVMSVSPSSASASGGDPRRASPLTAPARPCGRSRPRARAAISCGTVMWCWSSASESRTLARVIVFMKAHSASGSAAMNCFVRRHLPHPVHDPGLGGDDEPLDRPLGHRADHPLGRGDVQALGPDVALAHLVDELPGAAALGVHQHLRVGIPLPGGVERLGADALVHVALAQPDLDPAVRPHPAHVRAEEEVGQEEDALVFGDGVDHVEHVAAGAAVVELRLHLGRGVDVAHRDVAGELGLPPPHVLRRDRWPRASSRPGGRAAAPAWRATGSPPSPP